MKNSLWLFFFINDKIKLEAYMNNLEIKIDSVESVKKDMLLELNNILEKYNYLLSMVDDSKSLFDTNTGDYLRDKILENINEQKDYINNKFMPFVNKLDVVKDSYTNLYNDIKKEVI